MSNLKAEEIREIYLERLKEDLIGPKNGLNEVISEDPISRYLCGILWPSNTPPDEDIVWIYEHSNDSKI